MPDAGKTGGEAQTAVNDAGHAGKPENGKEKAMLKHNELAEKLIGRISQKSYGPEVKESAKAVMDEFIKLLVDELKTSGEVRIPQLGALKVVEKPADADFPARKVVKFSIGKNMKEYFQQG
jgi:nucleoid DNA-binding protein